MEAAHDGGEEDRGSLRHHRKGEGGHGVMVAAVHDAFLEGRVGEVVGHGACPAYQMVEAVGESSFHEVDSWEHGMVFYEEAAHPALQECSAEEDGHAARVVYRESPRRILLQRSFRIRYEQLHEPSRESDA